MRRRERGMLMKIGILPISIARRVTRASPKKAILVL
jgi:hypothetical protein